MYRSLITVNPLVKGEFIRGYFPPLSEAMQERLATDFIVEDTKRAVMKRGSLKAPRPNGFQPVFAKETWEVTGQPL